VRRGSPHDASQGQTAKRLSTAAGKGASTDENLDVVPEKIVHGWKPENRKRPRSKLSFKVL